MTLPLSVTDGSAELSAWEAGLAPELQDVFRLVRASLPESYLVGGLVRDLLMGRAGRDIDILSHIPITPAAKALARACGGTLTCHDAFLTCTLTLPSGHTLDLSSTRREHYPYPGALPIVEASDLEHDLYRRDFSVNTFALRLSAPHELVSVAGAHDDLAARILRVLHDRSFFDDPTRIVRGARLAGRLGFTYDDFSVRALEAALAAGAYQNVSTDRLKSELLLNLAEPAVAPVFTSLAESGALDTLYGLPGTPLLTELDTLRKSRFVPDESYLLALLLALSESEAQAFIARFSWPRRLQGSRTRLQRRVTPRTAAETVLATLLYPGRLPSHPKVRGSDVLSLGLPAGPEVGVVLQALEHARLSGEVASFAEELELAKKLVQEALGENA